MRTILIFFQIAVSILLIGAILLQQRGGGMSQVFGGSGGLYRTRRGVKKSIFISTIVLAVLFLAAAVLNIILR